MNHLLNLNVLSAQPAPQPAPPSTNWFFGPDPLFHWWQIVLFFVLIGLIITLLVIRKRGQ